MHIQEEYAPILSTPFNRPADDSLLIGCPICGRPAKVHHQLVDEEVACGHCRGTFVVSEQMDGSKTAPLTKTTQRPNEQNALLRSKTTRQSKDPELLPQPKQFGQAKSRPVAFVVEPRDEVYARLAGDLIDAGYRVVRAMSTMDALKACSKYQPRLVVAQLPPPDQTAWQLAPELALLHGDTRVVMYGSEIPIHDYAMADYLGVEQLIEYCGDLFRLSSRIRQLLGGKSPEQTESKNRRVA